MSRKEINYLFPLILDTLINKPLNCDTEKNLLKAIRVHLKNEGMKITNLTKEFEAAIDMGKGLGILTVQGDELRMPRLLQYKEEVIAPSTSRRRKAAKKGSRSRSRSRSHSNARNQRKSHSKNRK